MWHEVLEQLSQYPNAVLNSLDDSGYPFSLRCVPQPDAAGQYLRLELGPGLPIEAGPASLLLHTHDAGLQKQKNVLIRGQLSHHEGPVWHFTPEKVVPGAGFGGVLSTWRSFRAARQRATEYLAQRGMARPRIDWAAFKKLTRDS